MFNAIKRALDSLDNWYDNQKRIEKEYLERREAEREALRNAH